MNKEIWHVYDVFLPHVLMIIGSVVSIVVALPVLIGASSLNQRASNVAQTRAVISRMMRSFVTISTPRKNSSTYISKVVSRCKKPSGLLRSMKPNRRPLSIIAMITNMYVFFT